MVGSHRICGWQGLEEVILAVSPVDRPARQAFSNNAAQRLESHLLRAGIKARWRRCLQRSPCRQDLADFGGGGGGGGGGPPSFGGIRHPVSRRPGATQFGSGWAWLVLDGGTLKITRRQRPTFPLAHGSEGLCSPWMSGSTPTTSTYQNGVPDYMTTFLDKRSNWDFRGRQPGRAA